VIHFVVPAAHAGMMREYLELWGKDVADRLRIVHSESLPAALRAAPGTYVLAALDQHRPAMDAYIQAFHAALSGRRDVRVLNHPTRTLQRFALLRELHTRGQNRFRAVRVDEDLRRLTYPVFVRNERTHDGALSALLNAPSEVEAAVGRLLVQGNAVRDLMVVEFCDTADADGYFRKYSSFVVGDHIVPRSLSYSRSWMLKFQGSDFSARMAQEEQDYVLQNPHEGALRELFDRPWSPPVDREGSARRRRDPRSDEGALLPPVPGSVGQREPRCAAGADDRPRHRPACCRCRARRCERNWSMDGAPAARAASRQTHHRARRAPCTPSARPRRDAAVASLIDRRAAPSSWQ
jgi:hypothetical protein